MKALHLGMATLCALIASVVHATDAPPAPPPPRSPPASDESSRERLERELERAQQEMERAARQVARLSTELGNQWMQFQPPMSFGPPKVMLGINIGSARGDAEEGNGVRVESVSPGGPAEEAGLKANDVIVSLAGKSLQGDSKTTPQQQLLKLMREVEPDTPIAIEYRRDGKVQKARVIPKSFPEFVSDSIQRGMQGLDHLNERAFRMSRRGPGGFGSAELADLSPGLGRYFGTDKGLLVVRAPKDARLKLQDGDVILDIDGRVPNSASHAYEILSSYRAGETLKLHIMRQQKRMELPVEIPSDAGHAEPSLFIPQAGRRGQADRVILERF
jgi:predicted metalloprotease with PDZ domain